eukprot:6491915-Amphidinium_carterae.2
MVTPCYTMLCGSSNNVPIAVLHHNSHNGNADRVVNIVAVIAMKVASVMASMYCWSFPSSLFVKCPFAISTSSPEKLVSDLGGGVGISEAAKNFIDGGTFFDR